MKKEIQNKHCCPVRIWRKYKRKEKMLYNKFYELYKQPINFPKSHQNDIQFRDIVAHNLAHYTVRSVRDIFEILLSE